MLNLKLWLTYTKVGYCLSQLKKYQTVLKWSAYCWNLYNIILLLLHTSKIFRQKNAQSLPYSTKYFMIEQNFAIKNSYTFYKNRNGWIFSEVHLATKIKIEFLTLF